MTAAWDDVRFWAQVIEDSRRTIICSPELESRVKCHLDALGVAGLHDVVVSELVPGDAIYVADMGAIEASVNETMQRTWRL